MDTGKTCSFGSENICSAPDFMGLKFWKIEGFNTKLIDVCGHSQETIVSRVSSQAKGHPLELLAPLSH